MATNGTFSSGGIAAHTGSLTNNFGATNQQADPGGGIATLERELTIGETPTQQKVPNGQTTIATDN
jgi:hypothetical protein